MHRSQLSGHNRPTKVIDLINLWPDKPITSKLHYVRECFRSYKLFINQKQLSICLGSALTVYGWLWLQAWHYCRLLWTKIWGWVELPLFKLRFKFFVQKFKIIGIFLNFLLFLWVFSISLSLYGSLRALLSVFPRLFVLSAIILRRDCEFFNVVVHVIT